MESFDAFWIAYPKKVAKQAAQKAWKALKPNHDLKDRIQKDIAARCQSEQWTKENGRFIPNPASYLNGRRWEDEGAAQATPATEDSLFRGAI